MRTLIIGAILALNLTPALACSPAPSCWIDEGGPKSSYLKGICRGYAKDKRTVEDIKGYVDEPEKMPQFVSACKALGVTFKEK
jgi:hypothetical protein